MAFARREQTSKPGTPQSLAPDLCKCGKRATRTFEGKVDLMGKMVPVRVRMCDEHYSNCGLEIKDGDYSIGESDGPAAAS